MHQTSATPGTAVVQNIVHRTASLAGWGWCIFCNFLPYGIYPDWQSEEQIPHHSGDLNSADPDLPNNATPKQRAALTIKRREVQIFLSQVAKNQHFSFLIISNNIWQKKEILANQEFVHGLHWFNSSINTQFVYLLLMTFYCLNTFIGMLHKDFTLLPLGKILM